MSTTSVTTVSGLRLWQYPFAIGLLVVTVVVDAVNRMTRRGLRPHVVVEGLELLPSVADSYASSSVAWVSTAGWIFAALFHVLPRYVFGCAIHAMRSVDTLIRFGSITAAGRGRTSTQENARDRFLNAAIAAANPFSWVGMRDSRESHKAAKPLIREIDDRWCHAAHSTSFGA